jgi:hypothetical protein
VKKPAEQSAGFFYGDFGVSVWRLRARSARRAVTLCVALAAQIVFHFPQQRLQLAAANAQRHARGQNVDDHQVQQARDHGAVLVKAFGVVSAQVDVAGTG